MLSIALTLLGVAASIGISEGIDAYRRKANSKAEMTADDIIKMVQIITEQARKQGNEAITKIDKALNKVQTKLNEIMNRNNSIYVNAAGKLNDYVRNVKSDLQEQYNQEARKQEMLNDTRLDTQEMINNVERTAANLETRAMNLANQTEAYKNSKAGKQEYKDLQADANNAMNQFNFQNVEKLIGENHENK